MKIAYFTPLNPQKSGISDFSEELLPFLKKYMDIDLFIDGFKPSNPDIVNNFNIYSIDDFNNNEVRKRYDQIIYHIGNSKYHEKIAEYSIRYPGIVELHDVSLHHMIAGATFSKKKYREYLEEMEYSHGGLGKKVAQDFLEGRISAPWETESLKYTVNKRIVENAKGIIVHSEFAKQMIKGIVSDIPVKTILHHTADIIDNFEESKIEARQELGIGSDNNLIASFGFANSTKRIKEILHALKKLKESGILFNYYIVGEVEQSLNINNEIKRLGLKDNIIITGFVDLNQFKLYMRACDICLNLRYPTQGESSGSLHRIMGMGKVAFVTNVGAFSEYPDDVLIKIEPNENEIEQIYKNILLIFKDKSLKQKMQRNALKFAKEYCSLYSNTIIYNDFLIKITDNSFEETDLTEILTDKLFDLDIVNEEQINSLLRRLNLA